MTKVAATPVIPPELAPFWDDSAQAAHERLASFEHLSDFVKTMPRRAYGPEGSSTFIDISPREDHDREQIDALFLPYTQGWEPYIALRAVMQQASFRTPRRMIVLPNNTLTQTAYRLSGDEKTEVDAGGFRPLAEKRARVFDSLGIKIVNILGASQGASEGAAFARFAATTGHFGLGRAGLSEAVNMSAWEKSELGKAFRAGGIGPLNRAINDSAIPVLAEAQYSRGGLDIPRQAWKIAKFGMGTLRAANRSIKGGFTYDHFMRDLKMALHRVDSFEALLAAGADSRIAAIDATRDIAAVAAQDELSRLRAVLVEGYGHELNDNIVANALIGKMALEG